MPSALMRRTQRRPRASELIRFAPPGGVKLPSCRRCFGSRLRCRWPAGARRSWWSRPTAMESLRALKMISLAWPTEGLRLSLRYVKDGGDKIFPNRS